MKRLHVHLAVEDLEKNIAFYSAVFASEPVVRKSNYAKWELEDPRVNFAVSTRAGSPGLDHLGVQADSAGELGEIESRLAGVDAPVTEQTGTSCCYARSDKYWIQDPQGIAWESFHTLDSIPTFTEAGTACGRPDADAPAPEAGCCVPEKGQ